METKEINDDNKEHEEILRFMQDLEFVQCLANPIYLKDLSIKGYFDDERFVNYLKYLLYFKKAEYMKYITFERCIIFLELLQFKEFRQKIKENEYEFLLDNFITKDWIDRNSNLDNQKIIDNKENNGENKINENNNNMDIEN